MALEVLEMQRALMLSGRHCHVLLGQAVFLTQKTVLKGKRKALSGINCYF